MDQELTHITTHLVVVLLVLVGPTVFKKAQGSIVSNRIGTKLGGNVLQVNMQRLTELDFRFDTSHFQDGGDDGILRRKSVAIW